jgi:broad specificity phosphatase PhoE
MLQLRRCALPVVLAYALLLAGCAGGTLQRLPDGTYERESAATKEQRTADALRRDGAGEAARDAQKRADRALEEERRSPATAFLSDLLYMLLGLAVDNRTQR